MKRNTVPPLNGLTRVRQRCSTHLRVSCETAALPTSPVHHILKVSNGSVLPLSSDGRHQALWIFSLGTAMLLLLLHVSHVFKCILGLSIVYDNNRRYSSINGQALFIHQWGKSSEPIIEHTSISKAFSGCGVHETPPYNPCSAYTSQVHGNLCYLDRFRGLVL